MTESAYTRTRTATDDVVADRQVWGVNNLIEFGREDELGELIAEFDTDADFGVADHLVTGYRIAS